MADTSLFSRLQRLFSSDVIIRNIGGKRLKVMDSTALSLCMEHEIPVIVFDLFTKGNLSKIVNGDEIGTLVHS